MPTSLFSNPTLKSNAFRLSLLFLFFPLFSIGQSLTGLWTGALHNDSNTVRKDQSFEIALTEYNGKVYGYSRSEFIVDDTLYYILKRVKGTIEGDICEVKDEEIISYNFRGRLDKGIKVTSTFRRNGTDSTWYLDGTWKTNATKKYYSVSGKVNLSNEKDLSVSKIFPHLEELKIADEVTFYNEQKNNTIAGMRIARPERLQTGYTPNKEILLSPNPDLTVSAQPAAAIVTEIPVVGLPSVKKQEEALDKTTVNEVSIPATSVTPSAKAAAAVPAPQLAVKSTPPSTEPSTTLSQKATPGTIPVSDTKASTDPATGDMIVNEKIAGNNIASNNSKNNKAANDKVTVNASAKNPVAGTKASANPVTVKDATIPNNNTSPTGQPITAVREKQVTTPPVVKGNPAPVNEKTETRQSVTTKASVNPTPELIPQSSVQPAAHVQQPVSTEAALRENNTPRPDITIKAAVIAGRKSEFSQLVNFKSDSLIISLYDNGEIDGDTVSVFLNGEVLLSKQGLKSSAIKKTIYIKQGQEEDFTLVMFAESLGKYPPNTGLLVIRDGDDVYNLRFSSDFQKNAGIVFRKKK
ncbi:MAG: hypothetical protein NTW29_01465 [Bacteroidetes bacterium]|nr:hypothetical protein [Bacteroidota bacterium]